MKLHELSDRPGARKKRHRLGRGIGSGTGKTSGRGGKGQTARSGVRIKGFEGGQMPLHRRLPKRGFTSPFKTDYNEVNLGRVQAAIDAGKLDASKTVTVEALVEQGRQFDVVLAMEVVEHVADVDFFVKSCCQAVKPGGLLFLATLNRTLKAFALAIVSSS